MYQTNKTNDARSSVYEKKKNIFFLALMKKQKKVFFFFETTSSCSESSSTTKRERANAHVITRLKRQIAKQNHIKWGEEKGVHLEREREMKRQFWNSSIMYKHVLCVWRIARAHAIQKEKKNNQHFRHQKHTHTHTRRTSSG